MNKQRKKELREPGKRKPVDNKAPGRKTRGGPNVVKVLSK